jgi:prickle
VAVGKILFSPDVVSGPGNSPGTSPAVRRANKTRSPISTQASNGEVDSPSVLKREQNYVWVPKNTSRNAAEKYLKGLPREKCPIKGTPGERYRNRQLINQLPAYDIDIGQMRQDMSEEEEKQMELFLKMRRDNALGRGQIMEKESADQEWFCMKCSNDLEVGEVAVFTSANTAWHPACFTCTKCDEILIDLIYFSHDGKIFCGRHHAELIKPRCSGCDELILCREYTRAEEKDWHLHHFTCIACDTSLGGQRYVVHDDNTYCLKCNDKLFAKCCQKCRKMIRADDSAIQHQDMFWHANKHCFHCSVCKANLIDQPFLPKKGLVLCSKECAKVAKAKDMFV